MLAMYVAHSRGALLAPHEHHQFGAHCGYDALPPKPQPQRVVELPHEAALLKELIRTSFPVKLYAFSLAHMRKIAVPPVEIPKAYRCPRARSMLVGGHEVPYTRAMFTRSQRRYSQRKLDSIHEDLAFD